MTKTRHHPPHIYLDNAIYFISAHTYDDLPLLTDKRKQELLDLLFNLLKDYSYQLFTYSIVPNHYHLLFKIAQGDKLPDLFQKLHGSLSFKWNNEDNQRGRKIFQNYWDYCTKDEKDFWTHFNYINLNPIKHGLAKDLNQLKDYKFCGYSDSININGEDWMSEILENYPIINFISED
ncbi:MAG: transposase [Candidatus Parcubacteria bacterium]|nr:transposase [Candidatus Parcubacteria bacterium]